MSELKEMIKTMLVLEVKKHMKESLGLDMTKRHELEYTSFVLDAGWVEKNHHMTLIS
jgi:hypothetical protein